MTVLERWKVGEIKFLIATSALGAGLDYGAVRFVIHQGFARGMIEFCQESGRAGRDGHVADSIVFYWSGIEKETEWIKDEGRKDMLKYVKMEGCRKEWMSKFLHGVGTDCISQPEGVFCDNCEKAMGGNKSWKIETKVGRKRGRTEEGEEVRDVIDVREMIKDLKGKCPICWMEGKDQAKGHQLFGCRYILEICD